MPMEAASAGLPSEMQQFFDRSTHQEPGNSRLSRTPMERCRLALGVGRGESRTRQPITCPDACPTVAFCCWVGPELMMTQCVGSAQEPPGCHKGPSCLPPPIMAHLVHLVHDCLPCLFGQLTIPQFQVFLFSVFPPWQSANSKVTRGDVSEPRTHYLYCPVQYSRGGWPVSTASTSVIFRCPRPPPPSCGSHAHRLRTLGVPEHWRDTNRKRGEDDALFLGHTAKGNKMDSLSR